ncbi:MAG: 50S ribosomal protein L22 [Armatimonadetes bacterium]|nr:MAG: 50S ribosomal protein L22 [Armatimonadota bacterium]
MEIRTTQKYIATSPRKLRLVADMVRKMQPLKALQALGFTNKAAAIPLSKAIKTTLANAKALNLNEEQLVFKSLEINESGKLRRWKPGSRGRVDPYKRRRSHIAITLTNEVVNKNLKINSVELKKKDKKEDKEGKA